VLGTPPGGRGAGSAAHQHTLHGHLGAPQWEHQHHAAGLPAAQSACKQQAAAVLEAANVSVRHFEQHEELSIYHQRSCASMPVNPIRNNLLADAHPSLPKIPFKYALLSRLVRAKNMGTNLSFCTPRTLSLPTTPLLHSFMYMLERFCPSPSQMARPCS